MTYDKEKILKADWAKAKSEVQKMVQTASVPDAVAQMKSISKSLKKEPQKAMDMLFHGVKEMSAKVEKEHIPNLLDLIKQLEYPNIGGEDRATYFNILKMILNKISSLTGLNFSLGIAPKPEEVEQAIQTVQKWYDNNSNNA
jgi:hypothetical protein